MGNFQSNDIQNVSNAVNNAISNVSQNVVDYNSQQNAIIQNASITAGMDKNGNSCNFSSQGVNITQTAKQQANLKSTETATFTGTVSTDLQNNIQNNLKQTQDSLQGMLSTGMSEQINSVTLGNYITNNLITNINQSNSYTCQQSNLINQNGTIALCGIINGPVNITQNASQTSFQACLTNLVFNAIINDKATNNILTTIDQYQKSVQEGLSSLIWIFLLLGVFILLLLFGGPALGVYVLKDNKTLGWIILILTIIIGLALLGFAIYYGYKKLNQFYAKNNIQTITINDNNSNISLTFDVGTSISNPTGEVNIITSIPNSDYYKGEFIAYMLQGAINSALVASNNNDQGVSVIFDPSSLTLSINSINNVGFTLDQTPNSLYTDLGFTPTKSPNTVLISSPLKPPS